MVPTIGVETQYIQTSETSLPGLALQITRLADSYMIWVGRTEAADEVHKAALGGSLTRDWACAMPSTRGGIPATAASLFRSANSDVAHAMGQRLARRFCKQIFLSVDIPPLFGQGSRLLMEMEKGIVDCLKRIEDVD